MSNAVVGNRISNLKFEIKLLPFGLTKYGNQATGANILHKTYVK
jgi:hypothetical protein